jgi:inosine-uridine nucleoside N-ribohydrolase
MIGIDNGREGLKMNTSLKPSPVIIDTDMAPDDWMAILYLLTSPHAEVRAITVAATGEAHAGPGTRNALRLLKLADKTSVPVAHGREKPLRGDNGWPLSVRLAIDWRLGMGLPRTAQKPSSQTAVQLLISLIMQSPERMHLLALGPLTNLAEALQTEARLTDKIEQLTIMGGAVNVPGNITPSGFKKLENHHAEWNIYCDPYAASVVFDSGLPVTLVPLDVTNTIPVTKAFRQRSQELQRTASAQFVHKVLRRLKTLTGEREYYFWDPLAAVLVTHADIGVYEHMPLKVVQEEGPQDGRTLVAKDSSSVRVCTAVDNAQFEAVFLNTLNGLADT